MVFMHLHFDGPVFSGSAWKGWEVCFVSWHFTFRLHAYVVLLIPERRQACKQLAIILTHAYTHANMHRYASVLMRPHTYAKLCISSIIEKNTCNFIRSAYICSNVVISANSEH